MLERCQACYIDECNMDIIDNDCGMGEGIRWLKTKRLLDGFIVKRIKRYIIRVTEET